MKGSALCSGPVLACQAAEFKTAHCRTSNTYVLPQQQLAGRALCMLCNGALMLPLGGRAHQDNFPGSCMSNKCASTD